MEGPKNVIIYYVHICIHIENCLFCFLELRKLVWWNSWLIRQSACLISRTTVDCIWRISYQKAIWSEHHYVPLSTIMCSMPVFMSWYWFVCKGSALLCAHRALLPTCYLRTGTHVKLTIRSTYWGFQYFILLVSTWSVLCFINYFVACLTDLNVRVLQSSSHRSYYHFALNNVNCISLNIRCSESLTQKRSDVSGPLFCVNAPFLCVCVR